MTAPAVTARRVVWACAWLLASCAQQPVVAPPRDVATPTSPFAQAVATHRQLARQFEDAGDWYGAIAEWQILAILEPSDATLRTHLEAARAAQADASRESLRAANAAWKKGDVDDAVRLFLRTLAIDPDRAEAAKYLREIDSRRIGRVQSDRAARVKRNDEVPAETSSTRAIIDARTFDLEQPLALLGAGDAELGLRDLRRYVATNPSDTAGRVRIGNAVADQAAKVEAEGNRESALKLYQDAATLSDSPDRWTVKIKGLRKALGAEYNARAQRASATDLALAIKHWESAVHFDPDNLDAAMQLGRARQMQSKLKRLDDAKPK